MASITAGMIATNKQLVTTKVGLTLEFIYGIFLIRSEDLIYSSAGVSPQDPIWWMTHTPKYYFPKTNYGDFGATSFVLLVATLGI